MSSPGRDPGALSVFPDAAPPGSPVITRRRSSVSASDISELGNRPRPSPTVPRSFDPNDPEAWERQRTMDVDMAMHLSRARRETVLTSPTTSPFEISQPVPENALLSLSENEEREIHLARGQTLREEQGESAEEVVPTTHPSHSLVDLNVHLHQAQDPALLVPSEPLQDSSGSVFDLPVYQDNVSRTNFDFAIMEQFAITERAALGLTSAPSARFSLNALRETRNRNLAPIAPSASTSSAPPNLPEGNSTFTPSDQLQPDPSAVAATSHDTTATTATSITFPHRKLSESHPTPRIHHRKGIGGKMALFEGHPNDPTSPSSLPARFLAQHTHPHPHDNFITPSSSLYQTAPPPTMGTGILNTGHDRPYRFSFYSNALATTIHARSLSELPAEGQTFEGLFSGVSAGNGGGANGGPAAEKPGVGTRPLASPSLNSRPATAVGSNRGATTMNNSLDSSYFNHAGSNSGARSGLVGGGGGGNGKYETDGDSDASTWWLDVQSPTDEEMKMLSKVFSIHPLTTEDIQMEETREKIELFRNYYLVCFRSFDQDQYSPTYLEPLNMYIIVFREGILSFHFRPTPHPQNVRRRIKQLKDYINVTSDWISYALIDDITDAFGPLIQSIEYEVDSIDDLVLILKEAEQSDMLRRIGTCRKKVMGLLRLMGNKADVVKGLAKRCNENWRVAPTSDIGLYLSDIQDHLITMTQNLNHYEKILSRSHSNYLAQISIEMTEANNQINDVLSKLTALGTVLIPMNLVTGLWGMNVHVPGQNVEGYAWFVSIIAGLAAFACIGGYSTYKLVRRS